MIQPEQDLEVVNAQVAGPGQGGTQLPGYPGMCRRQRRPGPRAGVFSGGRLGLPRTRGYARAGHPQWPVRPRSERVRDVVFLVLQVSEQVHAQLLQRLDEPFPGGGVLRVAEFPRCRLDLTEQVRDAGVVGFELVHHGVQGRVRPPQRGKQQDRFGVVMRVHEPAVVQAAGLQLPQRTAGRQRPDARPDLPGRPARGRVRRHLPDCPQIPADRVVNPLQLRRHGLASRIPRGWRLRFPLPPSFGDLSRRIRTRYIRMHLH